MNATVLHFIATLILLAIVLWLAWRELANNKNTVLIQQLEGRLETQLESKHRAMLLDLNDGLNKLADRMNTASQANSEGLKIQFRKSY